MEDLSAVECQMKDYFALGMLTAWTVALVYAGVFMKSASAFLKVDIAMNIFNALPWLIAPVGMLGMVSPMTIGVSDLKLDGGHVFLAIAAGILMLYTAVILYICTDSEDDTVTTGILFSELILSLLFLMNEVQTYMRTRAAMGHTDKWLARDIYFNMTVVMILSAVFTIISLLCRYESWGGYTEHMNRLNFHIRVDVVFAVIAGLGYFGFPDWTQKFTSLFMKTDEMHAFLSRCLGIMILHSGLVSYRSTSFLLEMPKVRLLFARLVTSVSVVLLYAAVTYQYKEFTPHNLLKSKLYIEKKNLFKPRMMYILGTSVSVVLVYAAVTYHYKQLTPRNLLKSVAPFTLWASNSLAGFLYSRFGQLHD